MSSIRHLVEVFPGAGELTTDMPATEKNFPVDAYAAWLLKNSITPSPWMETLLEEKNGTTQWMRKHLASCPEDDLSRMTHEVAGQRDPRQLYLLCVRIKSIITELDNLKPQVQTTQERNTLGALRGSYQHILETARQKLNQGTVI